MRINQIDYNYKMREGSTIARKSNTVDVGVVISDTTKFHDQNMKATANGRTRAVWICSV